MTRSLRAVACVLLLSGCVAGRIQHPEALPHYASSVTTDDGWTIPLFRVPPAGGEGTPAHGTPVLLAHGTAVNRTNYLHEGSDLASFLAESGFDVWVPEYRGDRTSAPPEPGLLRRGDWDVDRIAAHDLPKALDHILATTGREAVFLVGHSLGGVLGYVLAQGPHAGKVAGLVAIGAPGAFHHPNHSATRISGLRGLLPRHGQLPLRPLARLAIPALRLAPDAPLFHMVFNADNVDVQAAAGFVGPGMENVGSGMVWQYLAWLDGGVLRSADGATDWSAGLSRITVPTLFLAGQVDHVVPPWTVRYAYDRVASTDKTWKVMGVGWGQRHDYGHGDLLIGDWAYDEVFPPIRDWLLERAGGAALPAGAAAGAL